MLYDLNIAWSPTTAPEQLQQTLSLAASLGYGTVALNHTLPSPPPPALPAPKAGTKLPHVLRRATLPLADPATSTARLAALAAAYDVLAVRPQTDRAFSSACLTLNAALVSLDLTAHLGFHFRPRPCMAAVARGVRFEVCYAQLLGADARGRANFVANLAGLVRATRGRGFVVSSEAASPLALRAPADVVNLLAVWGLAAERGLEGFRAVPRAVVVNEGIKRDGFRGVIRVVQAADADDGAHSKGDTPTAGPGASANVQKCKPDGGQPMSKRQAKKMKLAASSAGPNKP